MKFTTFLLILQLIFIVLKILNLVNFSWVVVFIPAFVFVGLWVLYVLLIIIKTLIE